MSPSDTGHGPGYPDLRVARVVGAREHPNADRLLVLDIDLGDEQRQIVAGIRTHYAPEELTGRHIVVVANLEPARLRGEVSEGMLLASQKGDQLGLLLAEGAPPGTRLQCETEPAASVSYKEFMSHELTSTPEGVTLNGAPVVGAQLSMDRGVYGRLV